MRCNSPNRIVALVRLADATLAVVETACYPAKYYVGRLNAFGGPVSHATTQYFRDLDNAKAELLRLELAAQS